MDNYIKPEVQKTIKRLSHQKNNEVLKNKIRSWILTRELSISDLIRACREKTVNLSPTILNKLGVLYGSGKEGFNEEPETAFILYLAAADLGNASAAGNVAQYYFDGRAPGGKNIDLAYQFCSRSVEGGADKFMLLSEILHEKRDYKETVRCLRKIIESKRPTSTSMTAAAATAASGGAISPGAGGSGGSGSGGDQVMRKKAEARKLEIQCLYKILDRLFEKVLMSCNLQQQQQLGIRDMGDDLVVGGSSQGVNLNAMLLQQAILPSPGAGGGGATAGGGGGNTFLSPARSLSPGHSYNNRQNERGMSGGGVGSSHSPISIPSLRPLNPLNTNYMLTSDSTTGFQSAYRSIISDLRSNDRLGNSNSNMVNSKVAIDQKVYRHHLPGWSYISDDLEGFDMAACSQLTARAEVLELETEALRSAYETAEARVHHGKTHKFSDEVINALMKNKVHEFQALYNTLQSNKVNLLQTWNYYIDIAEHTLRRQILTEKRFFDPSQTSNPLVLLLAREFYHRRLYDYSQYLNADWNSFYNPEKFLNEPLNLSAVNTVAYHIPSARILCMAERSLLEVAVETYGHNKSIKHSQQTGWTGQLNLSIYQPASYIGPPPIEEGGGGGGDGSFPSSSLPIGMSGKDKYGAITTALLQEMTYVESVMIGSAVLRYQHRTFPHLPPPLSPHHHSHHHSTSDQNGDSNDYMNESKRSNRNNTKTSGSSNNRNHRQNNNPPSTTNNNIMLMNNNGYHEFSEEDLMKYHEHYFMQDLGCSDDILHFLNHITLMEEDNLHYKENEKKLVELILAFLRDGRPFNLVDIQTINDELNEQDCTILTRIVYHYFIKRIIPWILSSIREEGIEGSIQYYSDWDLPLASAQGRGLQLVSIGALTFTELFERQSPYGIFYFIDSNDDPMIQHHESQTEKKNRQHSYKRLREQIININALYQKALLESNMINFASYIDFWKGHPQGKTIPTYGRLFHELIDIYGDSEEGTEEDGRAFGAYDRELEDLMSKLKI